MDSQQVPVADRCYWTADGQLIWIDLTPRHGTWTVTVFGPSIAYLDRYQDGFQVRTIVYFNGMRDPLFVMELYDEVHAALRR